MATYKGIQGYSVQTLASDPTAANVEGQLWYNSTSGTYKIAAAGAGAWSSGGALTTARSSPGGTGTQTATLCFGGRTTPAIVAISESYDGSTWTEGNDLGTARYMMPGIGTQTASLCISGYPLMTNVESYDGTSWSEDTAVNVEKVEAGAAGTTTAGIFFGGEPDTAKTELWNGTTWTEVADLASVRKGMACFGTSTAALSAGGQAGSPSATALVQEWDGTSWTVATVINTARKKFEGSGTTTAGIAAGGVTSLTVTEQYNGSTWTEVADLATGRNFMGSGKASSSTLSIIFAGTGTPGITGVTEEWNGAPVTAKTVTTS